MQRRQPSSCPWPACEHTHIHTTPWPARLTTRCALPPSRPRRPKSKPGKRGQKRRVVDIQAPHRRAASDASMRSQRPKPYGTGSIMSSREPLLCTRGGGGVVRHHRKNTKRCRKPCRPRRSATPALHHPRLSTSTMHPHMPLSMSTHQPHLCTHSRGRDHAPRRRVPQCLERQSGDARNQPLGSQHYPRPKTSCPREPRPPHTCFTTHVTFSIHTHCTSRHGNAIRPLAPLPPSIPRSLTCHPVPPCASASASAGSAARVWR